jgi:ElaB/YqjD/DUF883 family membrane-anchored ribosome-binding protein
MFRHRSTDFDTRASNIAGHLRAIEGELGGIGRSAGQRAAAGASVTGDHIADAIGPILSAIIDRFGRGQRAAVDQAASFGNDAIEVGARMGNDALGRVATQTKHRPMAALAVAMGVGLLIGFALRRS